MAKRTAQLIREHWLTKDQPASREWLAAHYRMKRINNSHEDVFMIVKVAVGRAGSVTMDEFNEVVLNN